MCITAPDLRKTRQGINAWDRHSTLIFINYLFIYLMVLLMSSTAHSGSCSQFHGMQQNILYIFTVTVNWKVKIWSMASKHRCTQFKLNSKSQMYEASLCVLNVYFLSDLVVLNVNWLNLGCLWVKAGFVIWSWEQVWVVDCAGWVRCISVECILASRLLLDPDKAAGLRGHALSLPGEMERMDGGAMRQRFASFITPRC